LQDVERGSRDVAGRLAVIEHGGADGDSVAEGGNRRGQRRIGGIEDEAPGDFELAGDELDRVKHWDPLDGVILFSLTGQWDKVPAEVWKHWLDRLKVAEPFPPREYLEAPKTKKRAVLASLLGVSRDVIYQRWLRLKQKFQQELHSA